MTLSETELIDSWRVDGFRRLGFRESAIALLQRWGVDLHDAEVLVKQKGCPPGVLALRILRPLDVRVVTPAELPAEQYSVKV